MYTKEQLESKSDFELSALILKSNGFSVATQDDTGTEATHRSKENSFFMITVTRFDINNPADMWPIIDSSGISLIKFDDGYAAICEWNYIDIGQPHEDCESFCSDNAHQSGHKNPLRAAAIVYLLVKGDK